MAKIESNIHKTSTGKIFKLTDVSGNAVEYEKGKDIFTKSHLASLAVGQILRSSAAGLMLERLQ